MQASKFFIMSIEFDEIGDAFTQILNHLFSKEFKSLRYWNLYYLKNKDKTKKNKHIFFFQKNLFDLGLKFIEVMRKRTRRDNLADKLSILRHPVHLI